MQTVVQNFSRDVLPVVMPRMLELEVYELREGFLGYEKSAKYRNLRREYSDWHDDELISRLRILCVDFRRNALEIFAVYDEFEERQQ